MNTATGLFSAVLYFILVAGLIQQDFLDLAGMRIPAMYNILGVWLLGIVVMMGVAAFVRTDAQG